MQQPCSLFFNYDFAIYINFFMYFAVFCSLLFLVFQKPQNIKVLEKILSVAFVFVIHQTEKKECEQCENFYDYLVTCIL